jgi:hypothetical protein
MSGLRIGVLVFALLAGQPPGSGSRVDYEDLPAPLRDVLGSLGITRDGFDEFIRRTEKRAETRVREGQGESLIHFILQSSHIQTGRPIEPALSAKAFVEGGGRVIPADAATRIEAFLDARRNAVDERTKHFAAIVPTDATKGRDFLAAAYRRAMRFLYAKEFSTPKEKVPLLYRERANSTDTAFEAGFSVDLALRVIRATDPGYRVHRVLVVGPGLDLGPRTDLVDIIPPQSLQPFAVADSLLRAGLSGLGSLRIHNVDIDDSVVKYLARVSEGGVKSLEVVSGVADDASRPWTQEYREYFQSFGDFIGASTTRPHVPGAPKRARRAIAFKEAVARSITAEQFNIVTERYRNSAYDLIVATNVFPYLSDVELGLALANISAMLGPDGYLIHNELRETFARPAAAVGLQPVQARSVVLASGVRGVISDAVWIYVRDRHPAR